ncbi:cytochrome c oxidase assembly factor 6 homolog [Spea bombifrons]|uniref:cytochrome c oxidase assembly factor 6 homolog n=1 Tax=Spea bombifrons TaxID=233779 RepID=UPI00234B727F|nr:cytochrome c oxidase assembly factor 6 homolog [Spea bombifrons]
MAAPTAKERKACWDSRDQYWKCLDDNNDDQSKCQTLRHCFENLCPAQWIKYFDKRRDYLKFKEKVQAGEFQPPETSQKI